METKRTEPNPEAAACEKAATSSAEADLRARAERMIREDPTAFLLPDDAGRDEILHELRIHRTELELRSEERQRTHRELVDLYENAPVGYVTLDGKGRICRSNRRFRELLALRETEPEGKPFSGFVAREELPAYDAFYRHFTRADDVVMCDLRLRGEGDHAPYCHLRCSAAEPEEAEDLRYRLAVVDITERKYAETILRVAHREQAELTSRKNRDLETVELRLEAESENRRHAQAVASEQESRFRDLVEGSLQGILIHRGFRPLFANRSFAAIYGFASEEAVLALPSFALLLNAEERERLIRVWDAMEAEQAGATLRRLRTRRLDGTEVWVDLMCRPIRWDGAAAIQSTVIDVTEQKEAEASEAVQRLALEAVYGMATHFDRSPRKMAEAAIRHLRVILETDHFLVQKLHDETTVETLAAMHGGALAESETSSFQGTPLAAMREGREAIRFRGDVAGCFPGVAAFAACGVRSLLAVPIFDSANTILGGVYALDTRERTFSDDALRLTRIFAHYLGFVLEYESLQGALQRAEREKLLGQIAAGVAHEVRNPLNAIMVTAELLEMAVAAGQPCDKYLERIRRQTERLAKLMRDILQLRRPVTPATFVTMALASLVRRACHQWESARQQGNAVSLEIAGEPGAKNLRVEVDEERMIQVLVNLLENAVQHGGEENPVRVTYGAVRWATGAPRGVFLRVRDRGHGLDTDTQEKLFDPFYTTRQGGSGLGLSIVKHIVERHGGEVALRNNADGPGCTAEIFLPAASPPAGSPSASPSGETTDKEPS